jgi:hypothetical protein
VTFEMLQQEENNRQVASAILAGVAGAANAYTVTGFIHPSARTSTGRPLPRGPLQSGVPTQAASARQPRWGRFFDTRGGELGRAVVATVSPVK